MNLESLDISVLTDAVEGYQLYEKIIRSDYENKLSKKIQAFKVISDKAMLTALDVAHSYMSEKAGLYPGSFDWNEYNSIKDSKYKELAGEAKKELEEAEKLALEEYIVAKQKYWIEVCGPKNLK